MMSSVQAWGRGKVLTLQAAAEVQAMTVLLQDDVSGAGYDVFVHAYKDLPSFAYKLLLFSLTFASSRVIHSFLSVFRFILYPGSCYASLYYWFSLGIFGEL